MKIAIIGITGRVGSRVGQDLVRRGHQVTGIARRTDGIQSQPGVALKAGDATQPDTLVALLKGHNVVVSASRFLTSNAQALLAAVKLAGVPRLLVVGGAGSMLTASGVQLFDTPEFPEKSKPESGAGIAFLNEMRKEQELDWTFLCPSALFDPTGPRSGLFRLGKDDLLHDRDGRSWISMEDYAIAMADEIESHHHPRQRFTVGY